MNIHKLVQHLEDVEETWETPDPKIPIKHFPQLVTIARIADLINAEFKSDPTSVQCFDLNTIVYPLDRALKELENA